MHGETVKRSGEVSKRHSYERKDAIGRDLFL
jgi:hypothetical protein